MGRRLGGAFFPFQMIASAIVGFAGPTLLPRGALAVLGAAVHIAISLGWGIVCSLLTERWRGGVTRAAVLVAVLSYLESWLVARATGAGIATVLPAGDRVALALTLGISLVLGMRFASSSMQNATPFAAQARDDFEQM